MQGEDWTFDAFYNRYRSFILCEAYQLSHDHHLAQDLAQETWVRLYRRFEEIEDKDDAEALIVTIMSHLFTDMHRGKKRPKWITLSEDDRTVPAEPDEDEESSAQFIAAHVERLPDRMGDLVAAYRANFYSIPDTAKALGWSQKRVRKGLCLLRDKFVRSFGWGEWMRTIKAYQREVPHRGASLLTLDTVTTENILRCERAWHGDPAGRRGFWLSTAKSLGGLINHPAMFDPALNKLARDYAWCCLSELSAVAYMTAYLAAPSEQYIGNDGSLFSSGILPGLAIAAYNRASDALLDTRLVGDALSFDDRAPVFGGHHSRILKRRAKAQRLYGK